MGNPWDAEREVDAALAARLVTEQTPLRPEQVASLGSGWDNTVWLVDGTWVFRFPRRGACVEPLLAEARLLPRIAPHLPVAVPVPEWIGAPSAAFPWPFVGYRVLPGRTADRAALQRSERAALAEPIGRFLRALHALPPADVVGDVLDRADLAGGLPRLHELLGRAVPDPAPWLERFADPPPPPTRTALLHGDLYGRHLLLQDGLSGVIDWGDAHRGDPSLDLAIAFGFLPPEARAAFRTAYGGPVDEERARHRACWHAACVVVYAREVGDATLLAEGLGALGRVLS